MGDCNMLFISSRSSVFCFYTGFNYSLKTKDRLIYVAQLVRTTLVGFNNVYLILKLLQKFLDWLRLFAYISLTKKLCILVN